MHVSHTRFKSMLLIRVFTQISYFIYIYLSIYIMYNAQILKYCNLLGCIYQSYLFICEHKCISFNIPIPIYLFESTYLSIYS